MHLLEPLGSLVGPPLFFSIKAGAETLLANFLHRISTKILSKILPQKGHRDPLEKKLRDYLESFPNMGGGVFPIPKTFVN